ncbi:MAG TPA: HEAT repeat domain-containing protein [Methanoregula sp.]|nr:HEAT repeat domain-containing protein [Methanoregula sp.]
MGFFEIFRPDIPALAARNDYPGLVKALHHNDPHIQKEAADALEKAGIPCIPALLAAVSSAEKNPVSPVLHVLVRIDQAPPDQILPVLIQQYDEDPESVASIFSLDDAKSLNFLIKMLGNKENTAQDFAINVIKDLGEPAWPVLADVLLAPSYVLRNNAAKILYASGWKPRTEEEYIQYKIAAGQWTDLVKMKRSAVHPLIALLSDPYYAIRRHAAAALGEIGDPQAVRPLCAMLDDPDADMCVSAAEALRNIPDKRAIPPLVKALHHPAHNVRFTAANSLASYDWTPAADEEKILYLLALERWTDLQAMGKSTIPVLVLALGDGYYSVRQGAAETLGQMGGAGREALTLALNNKNPVVRQTVTEYLNRSRTNRTPQNSSQEVEIQRSAVENQKQNAGNRGNVSPADNRAVPPALPDRNPGARPSQVQDPKKEAVSPVRPPTDHKTSPETVLQRTPDAPRSLTEDTPGKTILEVPDPNVKKTEITQTKDLSAFIAALHNADEDIRIVAVENLLKCGNDAADPLISALSDCSARVRTAAAEALGKLRCERAVPELIRLLGDTDNEVRCAAATALGAVGDIQAFVPLAGLLTDEFGTVRSAAVTGLSGLGEPAVPFLVKLLGHEDPRIRAGAAAALGTTGATGACAPLAELFTDDDPDVRESAARAVGSIGIPSLKILENAISSGNPVVRMCGVIGLGMIGEPARELLIRACHDPDPRIAQKARQMTGPEGSVSQESGQETPATTNGQNTDMDSPALTTPANDPSPDIPALIRLINNSNRDVVIKAVTNLVTAGESSVIPLVDALLHENDEIRAGAAEALVVIGEPSVNPLLEKLPGSSSEEKIWILHTLGKLGDRRAVEPVSSILSSPDPRLQQAALETLGYIGDNRVVGRVAELLHDPDEHTRETAARVLGYIGDPSSSRSLIPALGDEEYTVREIAKDALFEIGEPAIPALVDALKHPSGDIREGAATGLIRQNWKPATTDEKVYFLMAQENWLDIAHMGPAAIPPLTCALNTADEEMQMGVILTLGKMARPETVGLLAKALINRNVMIRQKAMRALVDMGESARQPLLEFASTSPENLRRATDDVLARIDQKVHSGPFS